MADTIKTATGRVHALLDAAMAAFAAGAVGFAGFVMPAGIVVPGGQVGRAAISLGAALARRVRRRFVRQSKHWLGLVEQQLAGTG